MNQREVNRALVNQWVQQQAGLSGQQQKNTGTMVSKL